MTRPSTSKVDKTVDFGTCPSKWGVSDPPGGERLDRVGLEDVGGVRRRVAVLAQRCFAPHAEQFRGRPALLTRRPPAPPCFAL